MIPKRRKTPKMGTRTDSGPIRSQGHLAWVRGHECSATGFNNCGGRMEAHHVRRGADGGTGRKPGDDRCVPLCATHHEEFHRLGHDTFERKYGIDLDAIAKALWKNSPHRLRLERKAS